MCVCRESLLAVLLPVHVPALPARLLGVAELRGASGAVRRCVAAACAAVGLCGRDILSHRCVILGLHFTTERHCSRKRNSKCTL